MIKVTPRQKEILKKYMPNYEDYLAGSFGDFLSELDDIMLDSLVDEEAGPNTAEIEHLYDEIYIQNKYPDEGPYFD